jgi:hypothetical protein
MCDVHVVCYKHIHEITKKFAQQQSEDLNKSINVVMNLQKSLTMCQIIILITIAVGSDKLCHGCMLIRS